MVTKSKTGQVVLNIVFIILAVWAVAPFLLLISSSLSSEAALAQYGLRLLAERVFTECVYISFQEQYEDRKRIWHHTDRYAGRNHLKCSDHHPVRLSSFQKRASVPLWFFLLRIFHDAVQRRLVPSYMMWTQTFHIKNTIWALIMPNLLLNAFYVIMMRSFFTSSIPDALIEAARIDGAGEYKILARVVIPLSKPMMATISLMVGLGYWNDWTNSLYYITDESLFSIQAILNTIITNIQFLTSGQSSAASAVDVSKLPSVSIRMAIAVIGVLPVLCIYPFFQKYFVKGIVVGGVKG